MPPLSPGAVIAVVGGVIIVTVAVVVALWWAGTAGLNGSELVSARLDALRTGLSIGIGGGGSLALYVSWRRQRAAEITLAQAATALAQKDRDHEHTEADARERRITDLYTKSVEQLGSDKAPVRLGGLYALERLAQDNPVQRQTIVNVLCAYLRMPYVMPGEEPDSDADAALWDAHRERLQEREVRLAAQRILAHHLRPGVDRKRLNATFWPGVELDLTNATLIDLDFAKVAIRAAQFAKARFNGYADFNFAQFGDAAGFYEARFGGAARFEEVQFEGVANFGRARFSGIAHFKKAKFGDDAVFVAARFSDTVSFDGALFADVAWFIDVRFAGEISFENANLTRGALGEAVAPYLPSADGVADPKLGAAGINIDSREDIESGE